MSNAIEKVALSLKEVCELTGLKKDLIYQEVNNGRLKSFKIGRRRLFTPASVNEWIKQAEGVTP